MDNYDDYEYEVEKKEFPWLKLFLSVIFIVVIVVVILLLLRFCGNGSLKDDLLEAGKEYYAEDTSRLPENVGECVSVTANELVEEGLLLESAYSSCDEDTLVKVCYLDNGSYHYTPILSCEDETTEFDEWTDGDDLIEGESDVRFLFQGFELNEGTKYYYPADETDINEVDEYYVSSPEEGYTYTEDESTGYKWYTNETKNVYYNNGQYVSVQPAGYAYQGSQSSVTNFSETKPASASYRTIEEVNMYRYQTTAKKAYACGATGVVEVIVSEVPCYDRTDDFYIYRGVIHVCNSIDSGGVPEGTVCQEYTDWSTSACPTDIGFQEITCENKKGYNYTDKTWQWYNKETYKSYYPSKSTTSSNENTYYTEQPVSGALKDEVTKSTVYKYYRIEENTDNPTFSEWVTITPGYVTEEELFEAFHELKYDVRSLSDILDVEKIKYEYKMQYRNVKE